MAMGMGGSQIYFRCHPLRINGWDWSILKYKIVLRESILTVGMHLSFRLRPLLGTLQGKRERVGSMKAICRKCTKSESSLLLCWHGNEKGKGGV